MAGLWLNVDLGGEEAWERLVGIVKGLLRRSLGHAVLTWEELVTALTEVEKVINCRPISYLWESANPDGGVPIPLCPEQFLLPPRGDFKEEEERELNLSDEFRQRKMWLSSMNDLWRKEYLHQVLGSQGEVWKTRPNPLKVGEVVLVADDREKRLNWKMGVVRQLIIGARRKMSCCYCTGEVRYADATSSQTVQTGDLC